MTKDEALSAKHDGATTVALKLALEALDIGLDYARDEQFENARRYAGHERLAPDDAFFVKQIEDAITAIREALALSESSTKCEETFNQPVAWIYDFLNPDNREEVIRNWVTQASAEIEREKGFNVRPLYTTPPQRKPLTDEEKDAARWRFLVDNSFDKEDVTQFHVWEHSWEPHSQTGEPTEWKQRVRGPALDRFIDRAIEAAHGIKGEA